MLTRPYSANLHIVPFREVVIGVRCLFHRSAQRAVLVFDTKWSKVVCAGPIIQLGLEKSRKSPSFDCVLGGGWFVWCSEESLLILDDPICHLHELLFQTCNGRLVHVRLGDELWELDCCSNKLSYWVRRLERSE